MGKKFSSLHRLREILCPGGRQVNAERIGYRRLEFPLWWLKRGVPTESWRNSYEQLVEQKFHSIVRFSPTRTVIADYLDQPVEYGWAFLRVSLLQIF